MDKYKWLYQTKLSPIPNQSVSPAYTDSAPRLAQSRTPFSAALACARVDTPFRTPLAAHTVMPHRPAYLPLPSCAHALSHHHFRLARPRPPFPVHVRVHAPFRRRPWLAQPHRTTVSPAAAAIPLQAYATAPRRSGSSLMPLLSSGWGCPRSLPAPLPGFR